MCSQVATHDCSQAATLDCWLHSSMIAYLLLLSKPNAFCTHLQPGICKFQNKTCPCITTKDLYTGRRQPRLYPPHAAKTIASSKGINQKVEEVDQVLEQAEMVHRMTITPSQLLIHPDNRGGTMASYHDVWTKCLQMVSAGVKKELLQDSIAIELSKSHKKQHQVQKNQQVVQEAQGHLASLFGSERFWAKL